MTKITLLQKKAEVWKRKRNIQLTYDWNVKIQELTEKSNDISQIIKIGLSIASRLLFFNLSRMSSLTIILPTY